MINSGVKWLPSTNNKMVLVVKDMLEVIEWPDLSDKHLDLHRMDKGCISLIFRDEW